MCRIYYAYVNHANECTILMFRYMLTVCSHHNYPLPLFHHFYSSTSLIFPIKSVSLYSCFVYTYVCLMCVSGPWRAEVGVESSGSGVTSCGFSGGAVSVSNSQSIDPVFRYSFLDFILFLLTLTWENTCDVCLWKTTLLTQLDELQFNSFSFN